jgi:hypothetical protein
MADWSPPESDFQDSTWSPPESDFNQPDDTAVPEMSDKTKTILGGAAQLAGSSIANIPHAAAHGAVDLWRRWTHGDTSAPDPAAVQALEVPTGQYGKKLVSDITNVRLPGDPEPGDDVNEAADFGGKAPLSKFAHDYVAPVVGDVGAIAPVVAAASKFLPAAGAATKSAFTAGRAAATEPPKPVLPAQEVVNGAHASQSMGAAAVPTDVSKLTPETQAEIANAGKLGLPVNLTAIENHKLAETLPLPEGTSPLRLRKGQALQDDIQKSDEKNMRADPDTNNILSNSITDQDTKLGASIGEIRRRATPDIVQRNNMEHGQAAVDAIKTQDNQSLLDIRAKYKALADQNGGDMPIDSGTTINNINARLKKGALRNVAANNGVISEIMGNLSSGEPMDFETFDNARTQLAAVQRGADGPARTAAGIVHDELNNMPLTPEAAPLRDLSDVAKKAAKARFDMIDQNPAYKAVVDDNVPRDNKGLHVVGADSPLAPTFMNNYALGNGTNASPALVQRLKQAVPDPALHESIEAATLNKLRDAAGIDATGKGTFNNASYRNAHNALEPKLPALLSPDSIANTQQLKQVSGLVNDEGKASTTNRSNTALTLQRFGAQAEKTPGIGSELTDLGGDLAASHLGPAGVIGKKVVTGMFKKSQEAKAAQALKNSKLQFAIDATKPGAGIAGDSPRIQRAKGGKVDNHEVLVNRLMARWKAAKKATDATTKPLLNVPDNAIAKALDIAGSAI